MHDFEFGFKVKIICTMNFFKIIDNILPWYFKPEKLKELLNDPNFKKDRKNLIQ